MPVSIMLAYYPYERSNRAIRIRRSDNRDCSALSQSEQMLISGNNIVCLRGVCTCQHVIVFRIIVDNWRDWHRFDQGCQRFISFN